MEKDSPYDICVVRDSGQLAVDTTLLREAVTRTLHICGCGRARIGVALVDDEQIARLNMKYLSHEGPTDVLTFNLADEGDDAIEGEVIISTDTALREAAAREHDALLEVLLYAVHGTLHLLGMDDTGREEAAKMHDLEDQVLTGMGAGPVYDARGVQRPKGGPGPAAQTR